MNYRTVSLDHLRLSQTAAQIERRKHLDKAGLKELTESVKTGGVINPILVRPLENGGGETFEIVAGERRFIAARAAGLTEVPAQVRDLSDQEVIELQLVENLQREGLHELAEAEGYEALQEKHGYSVDDLVVKVGKSKAYVYARLKLLELSKDSRAAFYSGELAASTALLLARLHNADDQKRMLKVALKGKWGDGEPMSFREMKRYIGEEVMLQLKRAPFDTISADLVPKAGPCTTCPKRSGNQIGIFEDGESEDLCTDSACFRLKRDVSIKLKVDAATAAGKTVLAGKATNKIFQGDSDRPAWDAPYKPLDAEEYTGSGKLQKIRAIIPKDAERVLVQAPSGNLIEMVAKSVVDKALRRNQPKPAKAARPAKLKAQADEQLVLERVLAALQKKLPARLGIQEFRHLVRSMQSSLGGLRTQPFRSERAIGKFTESQCHHDLVRMVYAELLDLDEKVFLAEAKRLKVDVDAIRKELTPTPAKKATKKPAKKK